MLDDIKNALLAEHHQRPQNVRRVQIALVKIDEGLKELNSLGHPFHLMQGPRPPAIDLELSGWPKVMFHQDAAPNGRLVATKWELADLGPGWFVTAAEAAHWDGLATQFAGRGGVPRRDVPALVPDEKVSGESAAEVRARLISEFKQQRDG